MNPKLLIFAPSPRNDPEFAERMAALPHDKIWMKYHPYELEPYNKAREFFLKHEQYTHFAICPDDLMITVDGVEKLWKLAQKLTVIMGTCNIEPQDDRLAMTHNLPSGSRDRRIYKFFEQDEIDGSVIQVPWSGTPFAIFQRSLIEKIKFGGDRKWNPGRTAFAYDIGIAHDLKKLKIKINVDTSVNFYHKRHEFKVLNNEKIPVWWWDRVGEERIVDPEYKLKEFQIAFDTFKRDGGIGKISADNLIYAICEHIFASK